MYSWLMNTRTSLLWRNSSLQMCYCSSTSDVRCHMGRWCYAPKMAKHTYSMLSWSTVKNFTNNNKTTVQYDFSFIYDVHWSVPAYVEDGDDVLDCYDDLWRWPFCFASSVVGLIDWYVCKRCITVRIRSVHRRINALYWFILLWFNNREICSCCCCITGIQYLHSPWKPKCMYEFWPQEILSLLSWS